MPSSPMSTPEVTVRTTVGSLLLNKLQVLGSLQYLLLLPRSGYLLLQVPNKAGCQLT